MVVAIIGLLSAVTLLQRSQQVQRAQTTHRQLVDDLTFGKDHGDQQPKHGLRGFSDPGDFECGFVGESPPTELERIAELIPGQLTAYALYTTRKAGDQPGRENPSFATDWKFLPDGVLT